MGEWMIHPGPPLALGECPSELLLTNGNLNVVYKPEQTCETAEFYDRGFNAGVMATLHQICGFIAEGWSIEGLSDWVDDQMEVLE